MVTPLLSSRVKSYLVAEAAAVAASVATAAAAPMREALMRVMGYAFTEFYIATLVRLARRQSLTAN